MICIAGNFVRVTAPAVSSRRVWCAHLVPGSVHKIALLRAAARTAGTIKSDNDEKRARLGFEGRSSPFPPVAAHSAATPRCAATAPWSSLQRTRKNLGRSRPSTTKCPRCGGPRLETRRAPRRAREPARPPARVGGDGRGHDDRDRRAQGDEEGPIRASFRVLILSPYSVDAATRRSISKTSRGRSRWNLSRNTPAPGTSSADGILARTSPTRSEISSSVPWDA